MSPENKTSLVVEIPINKNSILIEKEKSDLISKVESQLTDIGFFENDQIIKVESKFIKNAYPILDSNFKENLIPIKEYLSQFKNLIINGRNGKYKYNHIHDHIKGGREIISEILH